MFKKIAISILFPALLAGCATMTPYAPATSNGGFGFSEQKIETNKLRVAFNGNSSTSRQTVENFLLYRAAELTIQSGNDYFVIIEDDTEIHKSYSVSSRFPRYGRRAYFIGPREYYYNYPYYSYGFDWGDPYEQEVHEFTRYSAEAYISMYQGTKPFNNDRAFDAKEVLENLGTFVAKANEK